MMDNNEQYDFFLIGQRIAYEFSGDLKRQAKKIGVTNKIWYNYYTNNYSVSRKTNKNELINYLKKIKKKY